MLLTGYSFARFSGSFPHHSTPVHTRQQTCALGRKIPLKKCSGLPRRATASGLRVGAPEWGVPAVTGL